MLSQYVITFLRAGFSLLIFVKLLSYLLCEAGPEFSSFFVLLYFVRSKMC